MSAQTTDRQAIADWTAQLAAKPARKCNNNPCFCHGDYCCSQPIPDGDETPSLWHYFDATISVIGYILAGGFIAAFAFVVFSVLLAAFTHYYPATSCVIQQLFGFCK